MHQRSELRQRVALRSGSLVSATLRALAQRHDIPRQLKALHLTRFFSTVELCNGSVGAAMSYFHCREAVLGRVEKKISLVLGKDVLKGVRGRGLSEAVRQVVTHSRDANLLIKAVRLAVTSALSAQDIARGGDATFRTESVAPSDWPPPGRAALVVGYGGFLSWLASDPRIERVHLLDLDYDDQRGEIEEALAVYRQRWPNRRFTAGTRVTRSDLAQFDIASITGSTLSNGSLEWFLSGLPPQCYIMVQGQSAGIHPAQLFAAGVRAVATTIKPQSLSALAAESRAGSAGLCHMLEGALPFVYLTPR